MYEKCTIKYDFSQKKIEQMARFLSWETWAIRSQWLICPERSEPLWANERIPNPAKKVMVCSCMRVREYLKKIPQCIQHLVTIVSRWAGNLSQVCIFRLDTNNFKQPTLFLHTKNKKRTHYLFSYQHWLCLWTLLFILLWKIIFCERTKQREFIEQIF